MVHLNKNGYDGVVIAINPSVPEDEKLIQNIKADVIVANPYLKYGDDPYTLQYGQCGEKGKYIHFTPNFLLTNNLPIYGSRGRVFVHEWAHLRWGIFDEYNVDQPFYISRRNTIEATRCSTHITGINVVFKECQGGSCITRPCRRDSLTGLYEAKCTFIPEKSQTAKDSIMFMQSLSSVTEFCTAETHNMEAPNLQNKMCNHRSTWDVIKDSDDFQNAPPMTGTDSPPRPTFSLLKSKQRVVCLVLDKSGSMDSEDRLFRMNQAVELYLIQIIEKGSLVGMVTFESYATIQNYLTNITDENAYEKITANLPQAADGGTSICSGLSAGFQAIIQSNQSTSGSEIVLLTDGEDNQISLCFEEVKQSGAIIHTIALGPDAAKELETLSNMTGGHRFYANKDINGLTDAFSRISSRSGSITQQAIQLESKGLTITGKKWINGTVPVDSTIGNDTFFVVTWTIQKPEILLQDPKGTRYETSDFKEDKLNIRSARLRIPGIAETGTWTYHLLNKQAKSQVLTVTMTTRARSPTTLPVIATAHMSQSTTHYPSPMIVYAQVSQGFLPVLGINVTAIIESEDGHQVILELWDNGAGKIVLNPPRPDVSDDMAEAEVEDFSRLSSGGSFIVSGAPPAGSHTHVFPPGKITDLEAKFKGDQIQLSWTAPGNVLDKGKANSYIIRISKHFQDLQEDFDNATLVNTSSLTPKEAGSIEVFEFKPEPFKIENGTKIYFAIQAIREANLTSEVSNIAQAIKFITPQESSVPALGTKTSATSLRLTCKPGPPRLTTHFWELTCPSLRWSWPSFRRAPRLRRGDPEGVAVPATTSEKAPPRGRRGFLRPGPRPIQLITSPSVSFKLSAASADASARLGGAGPTSRPPPPPPGRAARPACSLPSPHPLASPSRKRQLLRQGWRRLPPPTTSAPATLARCPSPASAPPR
ncbi:calcium-activated chloride channel regulator 1-like [Acinonyx jubatus]|uniref:Calcium-activated chloride channel regulator 1-like n=1 Tax=Acinonyx jubatus TaxID=32536 RepID=A0ABM3NIT1_ACIJB|nr:calcium-activated chloride channel regulator 1-like [Acinonyx jubatus]